MMLVLTKTRVGQEEKRDYEKRREEKRLGFDVM